MGTLLVGENGPVTGWVGLDPNMLWYRQGDQTAIASGNADKGYISFDSGSQARIFRLCIYDAAGDLLGSAEATAVAGETVELTFDPAIPIVSGNDYKLGYITSNYNRVEQVGASDTYTRFTFTYGPCPATAGSSGSSGSTGPLRIWLEDSGGAPPVTTVPPSVLQNANQPVIK